MTHDARKAVVLGVLHGARAARSEVAWTLPEEAPVALVVNAHPLAVMMATPADLEDFAVGFLLAEGVIAHPDALILTKVRPLSEGWELCLTVDPDTIDESRLVPRAVEGRTGCGLCGVRHLADALPPLPRARDSGARVSPAAIDRAFAALPDHQPLNATTRSVHGAAFCDASGRIVLAREDVGRHTALDKLIGALARARRSPDDGFVVMTSRCSVELVQKAVRAGFTLLATVSAPTTLALDVAGRAGLTLAARARPDGVVVLPGAPQT